MKICSTQICDSNICDFDRSLKTECNLQNFTRNCHMLYYKQAFGNGFDRGKSKCCGVLMKHHGKVKSEQVITLQMAQQLKTKNINVVPGQLFCRQCKAKFLLETDSLY